MGEGKQGRKRGGEEGGGTSVGDAKYMKKFN